MTTADASDHSAGASLYVSPFDRLPVIAFYLGVFFPYLAVLPIGSDTQPLALFGALLILVAVGDIRVPRTLLVLMFPLALSVALLALSGIGLDPVRSVANYASLAAISWATYTVFKGEGGINKRWLRWSVYAWCVVGAVQTFVLPTFLNFLVTAARASETRGSVGLAPEPTTYALQCLLILPVVVCSLKGRERRNLVALLIVQILLFARSSMGALLLVLLAGLYGTLNLLSPRRLRLLVGLAVLAAVVVTVLVRTGVPLLTDSRVYALARLAIDDPALLVLQDQSGNERLSAIVFSIAGFFDAWTLPHGYLTFPAYVHENIPRFSQWIHRPNDSNRIMSGYGAALFELGFVGLLIPLTLTRVVFRFFRREWRMALVFTLWLHMLLMTAIPLAVPLIGFVIGFFAYYSVHAAPVEVSGPDPEPEAAGA
jgi:hypothetical protein